MRVTILGMRHCRIRRFGERLIRPEVPRGRPAPVRFDVQLLKATRLENGDREVKALLAKLEPAEALRSETPNAFRDCMASYNPLGHFGAAAIR
jgi:hypothetical protein